MGIMNGNRVDYTRGIEGCAYSRAGVIAKCPVCGRLGERRSYKRRGPYSKRYVHKAHLDGRRLVITEACREPSEDAFEVGDLAIYENSIGRETYAGVVTKVSDREVTLEAGDGRTKKVPHLKMRISRCWLVYRAHERHWEGEARERKLLILAKKHAGARARKSA